MELIELRPPRMAPLTPRGVLSEDMIFFLFLCFFFFSWGDSVYQFGFIIINIYMGLSEGGFLNLYPFLWFEKDQKFVFIIIIKYELKKKVLLYFKVMIHT